MYQQTQRWLAAGVFEAMVQDWRLILRMAKDYEQLSTTLATVHFVAFAC